MTLTEARDQVILGAMPQVESLARNMQGHVPVCVEYDDLVSAGTIGLIGAVDRYDGRASLQTFAQRRILGAMRDYLRGLDPLTRYHRDSVKREGISGSFTSSLDSNPPAEKFLCGTDPEQQYGRAEEELRARQYALWGKELTPREVQVVWLHYFRTMEMKTIGPILSLSESRISKIHAAAIKKLRASIGSSSVH